MSYEMNINTSPADEDGPSDLGFSNRRNLRHTSNQSSSTNPSPGPQSARTEKPNSNPIKPSSQIRSRSDQQTFQRKINVIPIAEVSAPPSFTSPRAPAPSLVRKVSNVTQSTRTPDPVRSGLSTPKLSKPGLAGKRTLSGSVWFVRPRSINRQQLRQSSDSFASTSHFSRSRRDAVIPSPKPLRPPLSKSDDSIGSGYRHEVKLETSFTESIVAPPKPQTPPRRRFTLKPRQVFSSRVLLAGRFSLRGNSTKHQNKALEAAIEHSRQDFSPVHNLTHSTALRRIKTSSVLQRVTSILCETEAQKMPPDSPLPKVIPRGSTFSPTSTWSGVRHIPSALEASGAPAVPTPPVSYSSSQRELRLGAAPTGTPEDNATYKVGDDVFFKVDISIRGGTSYLPSEARRIHTPPLPGEEGHGQVPLGPDGRRFVTMKPRSEIATGINGARSLRTQRALTKDWHDVQLQLLEFDTKPPQSHEVPIDYDIPEHWPSSPLCPRNDRYWRYVQGKLKVDEERHRICWMHGMRED